MTSARVATGPIAPYFPERAMRRGGEIGSWQGGATLRSERTNSLVVSLAGWRLERMIHGPPGQVLQRSQFSDPLRQWGHRPVLHSTRWQGRVRLPDLSEQDQFAWAVSASPAQMRMQATGVMRRNTESPFRWP